MQLVTRLQFGLRVIKKGKVFKSGNLPESLVPEIKVKLPSLPGIPLVE